jgi:hypothetical protein
MVYRHVLMYALRLTRLQLQPAAPAEEHGNFQVPAEYRASITVLQVVTVNLGGRMLNGVVRRKNAETRPCNELLMESCFYC